MDPWALGQASHEGDTGQARAPLHRTRSATRNYAAAAALFGDARPAGVLGGLARDGSGSFTASLGAASSSRARLRPRTAQAAAPGQLGFGAGGAASAATAAAAAATTSVALPGYASGSRAPVATLATRPAPVVGPGTLRAAGEATAAAEPGAPRMNQTQYRCPCGTNCGNKQNRSSRRSSFQQLLLVGRRCHPTIGRPCTARAYHRTYQCMAEHHSGAREDDNSLRILSDYLIKALGVDLAADAAEVATAPTSRGRPGRPSRRASSTSGGGGGSQRGVGQEAESEAAAAVEGRNVAKSGRNAVVAQQRLQSTRLGRPLVLEAVPEGEGEEGPGEVAVFEAGGGPFGSQRAAGKPVKPVRSGSNTLVAAGGGGNQVPEPGADGTVAPQQSLHRRARGRAQLAIVAEGEAVHTACVIAPTAEPLGPGERGRQHQQDLQQPDQPACALPAAEAPRELVAAAAPAAALDAAAAASSGSGAEALSEMADAAAQFAASSEQEVERAAAAGELRPLIGLLLRHNCELLQVQQLPLTRRQQALVALMASRAAECCDLALQARLSSGLGGEGCDGDWGGLGSIGGHLAAGDDPVIAIEAAAYFMAQAYCRLALPGGWISLPDLEDLVAAALAFCSTLCAGHHANPRATTD